MIFTAVTLGAGFKGGEIVPSFCIGATLGATVGSLLGMDPGLAAAIGLVSLFCGVINCPIASILLSIELLAQLICCCSVLPAGLVICSPAIMEFTVPKESCIQNCIRNLLTNRQNKGLQFFCTSDKVMGDTK